MHLEIKNAQQYKSITEQIKHLEMHARYQELPIAVFVIS